MAEMTTIWVADSFPECDDVRRVWACIPEPAVPWLVDSTDTVAEGPEPVVVLVSTGVA